MTTKQNQLYIEWKCEFCGLESFSPKCNFTRHVKYCKMNPNKLENPYKNVGGHLKGRHLSEETKMKLRQHSHSVSGETKKKISETCKKNKLSGGYRQGSGRGKKGTYKGYYCDSSWELAYVIYNLDHNIKFERNEELFSYEFNGEQHKYKPDFIENGVYVEVKGYFTEQTKAKEKAFPFQLKYIDKKEIIKYLDYVEKTYGKNFVSMYEEKTYNVKVAEPKAIKCRVKTLDKNDSLRKHQEACFHKKEEKEQKSSGKRKSSWNKMSEAELSRRKELILNSGVDIMKFGWVEKMVKTTGLSKHQIEDCVRYFDIPFFKRSSAK